MNWPGLAGPRGFRCAALRGLLNAGKHLDIEVRDHIVIGDGKWVSLREQGLGFGGK
ncbi:MAG: hypothetical protein HY678_06570 [Chloroflexi bacterium]|nr:hypothetical protein [Chloroflexota bacterium]